MLAPVILSEAKDLLSSFQALRDGAVKAQESIEAGRLVRVARYRIEEYVRWEDIDAAGIINYQAYLRFFGLAEAEMLRSAGLNYRFLFESLGIWLPRARVECDFHLPVKLDELLVVEAYFSRIGRTSVHLDFEVRRKTDPARLVASGRYVLVCVRQRDFQPVPVPQEVREKIARFVEPAENRAPGNS
jgi:YbgC/YbaW family acyl-CoA thioester hydrolase